MEDKRRLRQADFYSGIIFILFGLFVVYLATKMPMTASYGGVKSHWYVAPALFPLFIGGCTALLGLLLLLIAVRENGFLDIIRSAKTTLSLSASNEKIRVYIIIMAFASFIYVYIPYVDFFISITAFLFYLCIIFYPENEVIKNRLSLFFAVETVILLSLVISGFAAGYMLDYVSVLFIAANIIYTFILAGKDRELNRKVNIVIIISLITPLVLCPVFRYFLLVPLPKEGLVIEFMNSIFYAIKY